MPLTSKEILRTLLSEIAAHDKPENRHNYQRFHKEKLKQPEGLNATTLRKISKQYFKNLKALSTDNILAISDDLLASGKRYMRFFAFDWALKVKKEYRPKHFKLFEAWLKKYVDNWGACDHLCTGAIGNLVHQFPEAAVKMRPWTKSRNRWQRRAAAVSLIVAVRKGELLDEVFRTADILLKDADDMVQKGYGWMLKEATHEFP
ncbi:MAG: DNA alkylation repair protein, partial [candidate division Zixibacteria bacterium]|nr:DNA alkylation repair protein [candidate division Zixibacteria bacterium]